MKLIIIALCLILSGCGSYVDSAFKAGFANFKARTGVDPSQVSAYFGSTKKDGQEEACLADQCGNRFVCDRDIWNSLTPVQQEILIAHELGHALLCRQHTTDNDGTCYGSIMNPLPLDFNQAPLYNFVWCFQNDKQGYFNELVGK